MSETAKKSKLTPGLIFRIVTTVAAVVLGGSMALTMLTSVDSSTCEETVNNTVEGTMPTIPPGVPVYLEVMSGDKELNRKLRAGLEEKLKGHEIVERAARHAPKNAAGVKLVVTMWAPKWMSFWGRGTKSLEGEVRAGGKKYEVKGELTIKCTGLVNKQKFLDDEADRMLAWAGTALGL